MINLTDVHSPLSFFKNRKYMVLELDVLCFYVCTILILDVAGTVCFCLKECKYWVITEV